MATYFNSTDLTVRLTRIATWISNESSKIVKKMKYGELVSQARIMNLEYAVAILEAMECYTPVTVAADDGEINCLTEAQAEQIFDNIEAITGLCFAPKGRVYNDPRPAAPVNVTISLNGGGSLTLNSGATCCLNDTV
jgi:hypothetical protein